MEQPFLHTLRSAAQGQNQPGHTELREALKHLHRLLVDLAADLQLEYIGPMAGLTQAPDKHRLVIRDHTWNVHEHSWGAAICSTQAGANWRADWPLHGASRERQMVIVQALPEFIQGYRLSLEEAGLGQRNSARRIAQIADFLRS